MLTAECGVKRKPAGPTTPDRLATKGIRQMNTERSYHDGPFPGFTKSDLRAMLLSLGEVRRKNPTIDMSMVLVPVEDMPWTLPSLELVIRSELRRRRREPDGPLLMQQAGDITRLRRARAPHLRVVSDGGAA